MIAIMSELEAQELLGKIFSLPPEKVVEVKDFVEFLCHRTSERNLVVSAMKLSEKRLAEIWENPDDSDYDQL